MFERLTFLRRLQLTVAIAATIFVLVLGLLAVRTALGDDPALGTSSQPSVQSTSSTAQSSAATDDGSTGDEYGYDDGTSAWGASSSTPGSSDAAQAPMTTSQS